MSAGRSDFDGLVVVVVGTLVVGSFFSSLYLFRVVDKVKVEAPIASDGGCPACPCLTTFSVTPPAKVVVPPEVTRL